LRFKKKKGGVLPPVPGLAWSPQPGDIQLADLWGRKGDKWDLGYPHRHTSSNVHALGRKKAMWK
jgi:hypothetical protein